MQANDTVDLNGPKTLTLSPQSIAAILDALADKPYRTSNGPINEIFSQLKASPEPQRGSATYGVGAANGVSGERDIEANVDDGGNRGAPR